MIFAGTPNWRGTPEKVGHGWIMVNVPGEFTADTVAEAMNRGDYYPTTGVLLEEIDFDRATGTLHVRAETEPGVNCRVEFVTTRRDFDRTITIREYPHDDCYTRVLPVINDTIGRKTAVVEGPEASCTMHDDDLYIRADIISDRPGKLRRRFYPETLRAWTQPFTR